MEYEVGFTGFSLNTRPAVRCEDGEAARTYWDVD